MEEDVPGVISGRILEGKHTTTLWLGKHVGKSVKTPYVSV